MDIPARPDHEDNNLLSLICQSKQRSTIYRQTIATQTHSLANYSIRSDFLIYPRLAPQNQVPSLTNSPLSRTGASPEHKNGCAKGHQTR